MIVTRVALDRIVAHARQARPAECCGLLIGKESTIAEAVPTKNLSEDPARFLIDPKDHIEGRRDARRCGLDVVGFYHSHPYSAPWPSPTDREQATYTDHVYLIVSVATETPEARLFRFESEGFVEVPLEIQPI